MKKFSQRHSDLQSLARNISVNTVIYAPGTGMPLGGPV